MPVWSVTKRILAQHRADLARAVVDFQLPRRSGDRDSGAFHVFQVDREQASIGQGDRHPTAFGKRIDGPGCRLQKTRAGDYPQEADLPVAQKSEETAQRLGPDAPGVRSGIGQALSAPPPAVNEVVVEMGADGRIPPVQPGMADSIQWDDICGVVAAIFGAIMRDNPRRKRCCNYAVQRSTALNAVSH